MHIVGTAGHVDHGKSSLVIALTGHNPDRFIEEQQRGMTLDLGFAPLRFPDGVEAGIIDVPGHERFLHNMLAGAAGMELLLLVIAAPEGPKRQTFEHLHILNFLNVTRAIVVLTKIDLVEFGDREIAATLAREACRGTVAQDAPVAMVSTVTGEGVEALKVAIHDALVELAPRRVQAPAYLPVDRVFALPGHGTIVTGTLMQGVVSVGDALALQPSGVPARVKNLQIFGKRVESASGGSRVAVNLPGIDVAQIARGEALVAPREFEPARELVVDFSALPSAIPMLRRRTPVRVHIGSAEIPGQLRFVGPVPGSDAIARATLILWRPTVFYPGLRIIVRRMSPKDLLGGAIVIGAASPVQTASAPRESIRAADDFEGAPAGTSEVLEAVLACGLAPLSATKVAARANVALAAAEPALAWLVEHGRVAPLHKPSEFVSRDALDAAFSSVDRLVRSRHASAPWLLGVSVGDAARALAVSEPLAIRLLNAWHDDGRLAVRANRWHAPDFQPTLGADQKAFFEQAVAVAARAPYLPASYAQIAHAAAQRSIETSQALESLLAVGAFVRVGDDVYRRSQIERAQAAISALIGEHGQATMAQLRDVLGTSRKYALPLMEHFDSIGFTIRDGDVRRLRGTARRV
jgi:selenocysteine-specific elongation factor